MNFGMIRTLGIRHWVAWQFVRLAWYIYHDDTELEIALLDDGARVASWTINNDCWGNGLSSQSVRPGFKYDLQVRELDEDGNVLTDDFWGLSR